MKNGCLYILSNPSFPHLLKIGQTSRSPSNRAREISTSTGVPSPFVVEYEISVENCDEIEKEVHWKLKTFRHADNREFFEITVPEAKRIIDQVVINRIRKEAEILENRLVFLGRRLTDLRLGYNDLYPGYLFNKDKVYRKIIRFIARFVEMNIIYFQGCDKALIDNIEFILNEDGICYRLNEISKSSFNEEHVSNQDEIQKLIFPTAFTCIVANNHWLETAPNRVLELVTMCDEQSIHLTLMIDGYIGNGLPEELLDCKILSPSDLDILVDAVVSFRKWINDEIYSP